MLRHLHIRNYALIKELDIDFDSGFQVLTGETGAGKSIILGALNLVMGARADLKAIREGEKLCVIEAEFETPSGLSDKGDSIVIRRELNASGRSRSFVNDEVVTQVELKDLAARLIDIHSQHESLLLGDSLYQLGIVDTIAGNEELLGLYRTAYEAFRQTEHALLELRSLADRTRKDADYVAFQWGQLDEAHLTAGEVEELEQEQYRLSHAEEIGQHLSQAIAALDSEEAGAISLLRQCRIADADRSLQERIDSVLIELRDICDEAERLADRVEVNPERLNEVEERLDLLNTLCRKHNVPSVEDLIGIRDQLAEQMQQIDGFDEQIAALNRQCEQQRLAMQQAADRLTAGRQAVRTTISERIADSCRQLGIRHARIDLDIQPLPDYTENGHDDVQILFAANLGQSLRRVSEVASGGEISRVMLSIKALVASTNGLPTIIFDEIDTGVSGDIASQMGRIMQEIAATRQVIAITHLAQVAVQAKRQYLVYKQDETDHTETHIRLLTESEREQYVNEVYATISRAIASKDA